MTLMRNCLQVSLISAIGILAPTGAVELNSRIAEVTVYGDRAQVIRVASRQLSTGEHRLVFAGLPDRIDRNSIQLSGSGSAILSDIRFDREQLAETPDPKRKALEDKQTVLQDSLAWILDRQAHARKEKEFVQKIADGLTQHDAKEAPVELDPDKWMKMVSFYRDKLESLDRQARSLELEKRAVNRAVDKIRRELNELMPSGQKLLNRVEARINVRQAGKIALRLSYIIYGPSWIPLYDIRVDSKKRIMEVVYKGKVVQNTNEDWDNVTVQLSTAQPQVGGKHPELHPWYLNVHHPRAISRTLKQGVMKKASAPMPQMMNRMEEAEALEEDRADMLASSPAPLEVATASVEQRSTSVVFVPRGATTIKSDNNPHTVTITTHEFPAHFRYSTVPKLAQHAYLKAKATNSTEYPFLAGPTNVFLDNAFVANSKMELVAPTEEFWTFLGVDDAISVEHKLLKRYRKQEGIQSKTRFIYEYRIGLINNKKTSEEIVVWDQIPISNNEQIEVKLIEPDYREPTDALKMNEHNYLEWFFKLQPGQEVKIPLWFSIKYPKEVSISGL
ncbi:MAG: mucoidy inhibitor MuiA family protein [Chitinivibrionales bacterium]|nr:mucoidy inhibitor MuiA family protein [Chitinivibrionales bacterium]